MLAPWALATGTRQDLRSTPSTNTEQVPHSPAPQPSLVPVWPRSSRRKSSSRRCGFTLRETLRPLMAASMRKSGMGGLQLGRQRIDVSAGAPHRLEEAARYKPAHHLAAILLART